MFGITQVSEAWQRCRYLTCSVLPVRMACNCHCPFCFSRSSISALEPHGAIGLDLGAYFEFARARGAARMVVTGGGEPLLRKDWVLEIVREAAEWFPEVTLFTNGTYLDPDYAGRLQDAGLSYLCYSRHHYDDGINRDLMGNSAPDLNEVIDAAGKIPIRATCVMARGTIDSRDSVLRYVGELAARGIRQFTFKHTYVAYPNSVFAGSPEDRWAAEHHVDFDPFAGEGRVLAELPWGPKIREYQGLQVCYYWEPTPSWEKENGLCRSLNLLSNGKVYASLEDQESLLFQLNSSRMPFPAVR